MAKKKKEEDIEEDLEELEDLEDQEIESVYPKMDTKSEKEVDSDFESGEELKGYEDEDLQEDLDLVMEPESEIPSYKYLDLSKIEREKNNNYEVIIEGESHGFLNIFVKHLLKLEGVEVAAYKKTNIEHPKIFLKLRDGYKIKEILRKGLGNLRTQVVEVQKSFKDLV